MTAQLAHIVRHPIKSVGWEEVGAASVATGQTLPWDRLWAITHEGAKVSPGEWAPKQNFLRGVAAPPLMAVSCTLVDVSSSALPAKGPR